jgi:hypothetical protein
VIYFPPMSQVERRLVVSTDSSGVLGTPKVWRDVWGFLDENPRFKGFEMIGWGGRFNFWTDFLLHQAKKYDCNVVGIHGRTGESQETDNPFSGAFLGILNRLIVPTPILFDRYLNRYEYVVVHTPEIRREGNLDSLKKHRLVSNRVYVENHLMPGAVDEAIRMVRDLTKRGLKINVMFDLFHYIRSFGHEQPFSRIWEGTMAKLVWALNQRYSPCGDFIGVGVHIPIGIRRGDSLRVDLISDEMWRDLGSILDTRPNITIVLENQQRGLDLIRPSYLRVNQQRKRNERIVNHLTKCGVI